MSSVATAFATPFSPAVTPGARLRADGIVIPGVKPASALEVRPAPDMVPFGIASLDALTGGVPRGGLTEIVGAASSGRTSITMSLMAEITRRQEVCALIDVTDSFDPASAEAAGVDLRRLLWVRCGKEEHAAAETKQKFAAPLPVANRTPQDENARSVHQAITGGCFEAARGRKEAVTMRQVAPPAKNISWSIHENYDSRLRHAMLNGNGEPRAAWNMRRAVARPKFSPEKNLKAALQNVADARRARWNRLDQALKATDLLLQSGGFGLIVIDLGDITADQSRRIPLTSWFRFRRVVENTPTILLVIARDSCAKTCASLVMQLSAEARQSGHPKVESVQKSLPHISLLDGLNVGVDLARTRLERKPVRSATAHLQTQTSWKKMG
ncbi:MAG TPA: hypothetical protein VN577_17800 [Terriglobales bacterium]|nr:hypothetical protein [Terriglobales bacterium]